MKRLISLELSEDLIAQVKAAAAAHELSMSAFIRIALQAYLKSLNEGKER